MMPLAERKAQVKTHPRVKFHDEATACTSMASNRASVAAYNHPDPEIRKQKQDKARCKNAAHWQFTSLKGSWASDGDYCWSHLMHRGVMCDTTEERAFSAWWTQKYGGGK